MILMRHLPSTKTSWDLKIKTSALSLNRGTETETIFAFLSIGDIELEFIQPLTENFRAFLGNPQEGINHIAFVVDNLEEDVKAMEQKGVRLGHVTKNGILNMKRSRVAYFDPKDTGGMLIEFVEPLE